MEPLICPGGVALGRFELTVVPPSGGAPRPLESVNRLLDGYKISYRPLQITAVEKKKVRISLLVVPSQGAKIVVFDPKPADEPAEWIVPFRTQIASLVWGPEGLSKARVTSMIAKNDELIGQMADYAEKTEEAQTIIEGVTAQQRAQDVGLNVDAAVAGFASRFPSAKIDPTQPASLQLATLVNGVNPALAAYDPLAQSPQQQAAQTAGLAAAVAGLFFGNGVGLAAGGGAVLVNLHSLMFPQTQFLSALSQGPGGESTNLCGSKATPTARTQFAYLWATRIPDSLAPQLSLPKIEHLAIGVSSSFPLNVDAKNWDLAARVQDWRLVSNDEKTSIAVPVKVDPKGKTIQLDLSDEKLKSGPWKLAANWDWDPIDVSGDLALHDISHFDGVRLTPESHDRLHPAAGTVDLQLTGADFEFVKKIEFKKQGDPFAQPETVPFRLPTEPPDGPETSMRIRMDAKPLAMGNYVFLIAQSDGKEHETPFKVLPPPPAISGTPLVLNIGTDQQTVLLHGTGLDRIDQISADHAEITLGDSSSGNERSVTIKLAPDVKAGALLALQLKVKDFEQPVTIEDALLVAGPKPAITSVRQSHQDNLGIALNSGEIARNSLVSFELNVLHASSISAIRLACEDGPGVSIKAGESNDNARFIQESPDSVFLSFRPEGLGQSGCQVSALLETAHDGQSAPRKLGMIVRLPKIDSFQLTDQKTGDGLYAAVLQGQDLESIAKVGWDDQRGTPVDAIPAPVEGPGNKESLRISMPWPAPSPHAPLYIWLRGEDKGRLAAAKF
ncbi:MAG TPA: hypothetical protein VK789_14435 [Bryobacteraceae bacterium]|nr:hypothetical protein [Bryobacteraceae bacterium]